MGACQSCLGLGRREENEAEHARLIDDDLYPGGYGYGSINHANPQQSDSEDLKREREALEAICQRASDTVIDIWALQSQPHLQPRATLPSNDSPSSSRVPSGEMRTPMLDDDTSATHGNGMAGTDTVKSVSSIPATASPSNAGQKHLTPAPKNWGEVVISPRRKKNKASPANGAGDIFDVLKVN